MRAAGLATQAAVTVALSLSCTALRAQRVESTPPGAWAAAFTFEPVAMPPGHDPQIGGLGALPDGRLAMCLHRGEVLIHDPATGAWSQFAEGLHEPLGLLVESSRSMLVMQRCELTRLADDDGDGTADRYETVFDDFGMSGNYHEFAFGPARDADGNLYLALNVASNGAGIRDEIRGQWTPIGVDRADMLRGTEGWQRSRERAGRMYSRVQWRGWILRLSPDGSRMTPFACGLRSPDGIGFDAAGRLLVTDNQGDWLGTSKVHHVREGHFHGHPASLVWRHDWDGRDPLQVDVAELDRARTPAMMLLPQGELADSPTQPVVVPASTFGPLAGQTLVGEMNRKSLVRLLPDPVGDVSQGAAIPFLDCDELGAGNHRLLFTADGSLWVGKTHLSWAGAEGLLRVRWRGAAAGLCSVLAVAVVGDDGFELRFAEPVAADSVGTVRVKSHTYAYHRDYGSPKLEARDEQPLQARLDDDGMRLRLQLPKLGTQRVYVMDLTGVVSRDGRPLLGGRVYYTLLATRGASVK